MPQLVNSIDMNNFYSESELYDIGFKKIGSNIQISRDARIYGAKFLELKSNIRVDDFSVISIQSDSYIGNHVHISTGVKIIASLGIEFQDFTGASINSILLGDTDDFSGKYLTNPTINKEFRNVKSERVVLKNHAVVLAGSIMLPGSELAEGAILGANSLLNKKTEEWTIYIGNPARGIKQRNLINK